MHTSRILFLSLALLIAQNYLHAAEGYASVQGAMIENNFEKLQKSLELINRKQYRLSCNERDQVSDFCREILRVTDRTIKEIKKSAQPDEKEMERLTTRQNQLNTCQQILTAWDLEEMSDLD